MRLNHLYLLVKDLDRSRAFYRGYFGFDREGEWQGETYVIRDQGGFSLALTPDPSPPAWPRSLHFGLLIDDVAAARATQARLEADGVPILEAFSEPAFAVFKCVDPDGYVVEVEAGVPTGTY